MRIIRYSLLFLIVFLVVTASGQTLRIPPNTTETSTVTVTQPSNGVISGWGISCGTSATDCAESFLNFTTVTLTATPDSGAVFNGWSGACADRGTNTTCTLTLSAGVAVAASFTLTTRNLTITKAGTGVGHVYDADFNIICSDSCLSYSHDYPLNTSVTIHAWPTGTDTWSGYSGNCSGTGENPPLHDCTLTMSSDKAVTVTFLTSASFTMYAKASSQGALSTGTCTTVGTACTVARALSLVTAGQTIGLLGTNPATDGLYRGANDMLNLTSFASGKSGTSDTNRITVAAVTEGGVFIDGEGVRTPFRSNGHSWWSFSGFDAGNGGPSGEYVMDINSGTSSTGLKFQRIVAYQAPTGNSHVWSFFAGCQDCVFEDIAGFGRGRNIFIEGGTETGTVIRRAWLRWEGQIQQGANSPFQTGYNGTGGIIYENLILVWNPVLDTTNTVGDRDWFLGFFRRDPPSSGTAQYRGTISYALGALPPAANATPSTNIYGGIYFGSTPGPNSSIVDAFVDVRSQDNRNLIALTSGGTLDRYTGIKLSSQTAGSTGTWSVTNPNECNATLGATGASLGGCPSFYTGDTPGTGSRACYQYEGGTLTGTALWPWPMDDRIKAALARANAAGTGGSPLAGAAGTTGAGTAYAANTVTSEIVSRYGSVPTACSR